MGGGGMQAGQRGPGDRERQAPVREEGGQRGQHYPISAAGPATAVADSDHSKFAKSNDRACACFIFRDRQAIQWPAHDLGRQFNGTRRATNGGWSVTNDT